MGGCFRLENKLNGSGNTHSNRQKKAVRSGAVYLKMILYSPIHFIIRLCKEFMTNKMSVGFTFIVDADCL